ncbi:glycosyltransferase family 4 protein [Terribacillus halophilus]|uniref:glycosyltransferase family 4 protein n=1 Tax=Terribacillus halophilus TaxID=361279 RepID=UPI003981D195
MVGSSPNVKGGITTVINHFRNNKFSNDVKITFLSTYVESTKIKMMSYYIFSLFKLIFLLLFKNIDVVHIHMSERGSFVRKYFIFTLSKTFNKKIIIHMHGAEFHEFYVSSSKFLKKCIVKLLKDSDIVIALGNQWKKRILDIEPDTNIKVLKNAVDIPMLPKKVKVNTIHVLFLAVLIKRKGIVDLVHAASKLVGNLYDKYNIVFDIGGSGAEEMEVKELVNKLGLSENFKFHGWIGNAKKKELLSKADIFVLPSYNEGLPMSILEAMSYGLPIISTNVGSIDEAVISGENGYLISPGNIEELSKAIEKIITDNQFITMGNKSYSYALTNFSNEQYFKKVEQMYLELS